MIDDKFDFSEEVTVEVEAETMWELVESSRREPEVFVEDLV